MKNLIKDKVVDWCIYIEDSINDGFDSSLQAYIEAKQCIAALEALLKNIQDKALEEAYHEGEKIFYKNGAKISIRSNAGKWDFSNVTAIKPLKDRIKQLEDCAKAACKLNKAVVDEETGEIIPAAIYIEGKDNLFIQV